MKVAIIGSGNVATHLAKALTNVGIPILNIWSYHITNAQTLANAVGAKAVTEITQIANGESDIIFIAVKDDVIETIAAQLVNYNGLIVHTSGSVPLTALSGHKNYGVLYPLQTFSKHKEVDFSNVPLCLEANTSHNLSQLTQLANLISHNVYSVASEERKILHLAAVFACNFPNYLYSVAQQLLEQHQLDFNMIRPLIGETANKVQTSLPTEVQTGPAIRNDEQTINKHETLLQNTPQWLELYTLLSNHIKKTA